ncbi:MAG: hypothetical protein JJ957_08170 [Pseudomonadales bacterium]|nr:hypothetical protein [Pseudomonadales bacterium]MBO6597967.1 hypothetical protein [Pseudomonadales bacterium]MBO6823011.1 hypothetical protein [Pseudomonadales bacterium]
MKKRFLLPFLVWSISAFGADSSVLKEIMGESVYEQSGISDLSEDELRVLESWILNNAVEKRVVSQPPRTDKKKKDSKPSVKSQRAPEPTAEEMPMEEAPAVAAQPAEPEAPRYVRLAEPEEVEEVQEEEPVTQKYVLVDTLDERDRARVEPDLIRSRIEGNFKGWRNNKTRFKLENGEIWEQRQSSTYVTNLESPEVIIRKHRFGYTMEVPTVGRKVHVRRIK